MAKGFKKGPKDPFADLTPEFRDAVTDSTREEIENRIAEVALADVELRTMKEDDQDLAEKAEAHKEAGAVYRDGFKSNKLKIKFMKQVLDDKGGFKSTTSA